MAEDNRQPAAAPTSSPDKRTVGEALKEARNAQGLTLEQMATELRIELPQLDALEGDRFERIGVPVFVKGYLRQYGARLGLDPRDLLAQYYKQTSLKEVLVQPSKTIKLHDERQITAWVIAALAILVVVVGLAAWWVGAGGSTVASGSSATPKAGSDVKPASAAPAAAPEAASAPVSGSAAPPEPAPSPSPSTPAATPAASGSVAPAATPTPSATAPAGTPAPSGAATSSTTTLAVATPPPSARAAADRPAAASATPAAVPNATATSPAAAASGAQASSDDGGGAPTLVVPLELTFEQESWAEITDARGERIYYGLGTAGKHAQIRGQPPFAVVLGNAAGVKIVVDGEDFAIPAKGKPGEYARFSVNVVSD
jgi:cytoskeleton protein RodZ